jgi:hypothetical protein
MKMPKFLKNFLKLTAVSAFAAISFLSYMYFIGIPKTKAALFYNLAVTELKSGNSLIAEAYLKDALSYWREKYILEKLKEIDSK